MKSVGYCPTSDVITFDQNWHHVYSSSAGGKYISNGTQIRVIGSMEHEICTKMLRNLSEKLVVEFPATTLSYPMVKIAHLDDAFSDVSHVIAKNQEPTNLFVLFGGI